MCVSCCWQVLLRAAPCSFCVCLGLCSTEDARAQVSKKCSGCAHTLHYSRFVLLCSRHCGAEGILKILLKKGSEPKTIQKPGEWITNIPVCEHCGTHAYVDGSLPRVSVDSLPPPLSPLLLSCTEESILVLFLLLIFCSYFPCSPYFPILLAVQSMTHLDFRVLFKRTPLPSVRRTVICIGRPSTRMEKCCMVVVIISSSKTNPASDQPPPSTPQYRLSAHSEERPILSGAHNFSYPPPQSLYH